MLGSQTGSIVSLTPFGRAWLGFGRNLGQGPSRVHDLATGTSNNQIARLRQTANYYRHARTPRPTMPIPHADALTLLRQITREWIDAKLGHYGSIPELSVEPPEPLFAIVRRTGPGIAAEIAVTLSDSRRSAQR